MAGVTIFFVLSGYLITRILLEARQRINNGLITNGKAIFYFYIRRALRIFPLYYLVLFIVVTIGVYNFGQSWPWHAFYTSNIYFFKYPRNSNGLHLWTLSVEEQFYLVWPWLIMYIKEINLPYVMFGCIFTSLIFRLVVGSLYPEYFVHRLTLSVLDSFGLGGLLAWVHHYPKSFKMPWIKILNLAFYVSIASCILLAISHPKNEASFKKADILLLSSLIYSIISVWLVNKAIFGFGKPLKYIVEFPLFVFIGRISYSLYLFHMFLPDFTKAAGYSLPLNSNSNIMVNTLILLALSTLSWYIFEKPFLSLKKHFQISKTANTG